MAKSIVLDRFAVVAEMMRQDLTVVELSQRAGVGFSAINKARTGAPIWRTTARHIADGLGVPLDDLRQKQEPQEVPECRS